MEKIIGEFGVVTGIKCPVGVPSVIVEAGELSDSINKNSHFRYGYPVNCPRTTDETKFDPDQELGCIACPSSIQEFAESEVYLNNRTGEVSPL